MTSSPTGKLARRGAGECGRADPGGVAAIARKPSQSITHRRRAWEGTAPIQFYGIDSAPMLFRSLTLSSAAAAHIGSRERVSASEGVTRRTEQPLTAAMRG